MPSLTEFYLDKSMGVPMEYALLAERPEYGNQLTKITRNVLWIRQRWEARSSI